MVWCGLEKEGEEARVFVCTYSLKASVIVIGCRWERIFDEFDFVLLGIVECLI
jgi:hypothetical protein